MSTYFSIRHSEVTGDECVGGIVGGGYANYIGEFAISNTINYGTITGNDYVGGIIGGNYPEVHLNNCCNNSDVITGNGIIERGTRCEVINCFWLNDVANNKGVEAGFGMDTSNFNVYENCSYFIPNETNCQLFQLSGKDLVEELNTWVNQNGQDKYRRWIYKKGNDGKAYPALEEILP